MVLNSKQRIQYQELESEERERKRVKVFQNPDQEMSRAVRDSKKLRTGPRPIEMDLASQKCAKAEGREREREE